MPKVVHNSWFGIRKTENNNYNGMSKQRQFRKKVLRNFKMGRHKVIWLFTVLIVFLLFLSLRHIIPSSHQKNVSYNQKAFCVTSQLNIKIPNRKAKSSKEGIKTVTLLLQESMNDRENKCVNKTRKQEIRAYP